MFSSAKSKNRVFALSLDNINDDEHSSTRPESPNGTQNDISGVSAIIGVDQESILNDEEDQLENHYEDQIVIRESEDLETLNSATMQNNIKLRAENDELRKNIRVCLSSLTYQDDENLQHPMADLTIALRQEVSCNLTSR